MWIYEKNGSPEVVSNNPSDNITKALRKKAGPEIPIYRTVDTCFNAFAALAFAQQLVPGPEVEEQRPALDPETGEPVLGEDEQPLTETVMVPGPQEWAPVGNTWAVEEGLAAVVRSPEGDMLDSWPLVPVP